MENASKALIMAASVLLGIMIISVGVTLFNSFGGFSRDITSEVERRQIEEFNIQFLKYYGETTEYNQEKNRYEKQKIKVTTHDIVTLANLAKKNNTENQIETQTGKNQNSSYIQIELIKKYKNLEKLNEEQLANFIKENNMKNNDLETRYYYISNVEINKTTGKVIYVQVEELK